MLKNYGRNRIKIRLVISRPIRIDSSRFVVSFNGLDSSQFSVSVSQNYRNYSLIVIVIEYYQHLQGKKMSLSYTSARRLSQQQDTAGRVLTAITFSSSFDLNSYPPANFYTD